MPGEYDRYNMRRVVSMTATSRGEDLGRVARAGGQSGRRRPGEPPRGVQVDVRGQVSPMQQMFRGLALGLWAGRGRDLPAADRLFPVAAAGAGRGRHGAGGDGRRGRGCCWSPARR